MIGRCMLCVASLLLVSLSTQATEVSALRENIDAAVLRGDAAELAKLSDQLSGVPGDWADYYRAYVDYRRSQLPGTAKKQAKDWLNDCIATLDGLLERRPELAEAYALQASCYGASAGYYMLRAMTRGSAASRLLDEALRLDSANPRVLLQEGQSLMFRPAIAGGDKQLALERLQVAAEQFANWRSPDPEAPLWGEAETWLFIGRLQREAGDAEAARLAFEKALAIAPDYEAARAELAGTG